jgi:hypothetical protein
MFSRLLILAKVLWRLGLINIARVFFYRLRLKLGHFERLTPPAEPIRGTLFLESDVTSKVLPGDLKEEYIERADLLLSGRHSFFFSQLQDVGCPPRWRQWKEACHGVHWTKVSINTVIGEDVKRSWDLSRFHWMPSFAAAFAVSGDDRYLRAINTWFDDWSEQNAPNTGVNWVCAQEVSIRLINILNTAFLLGVHDSSVSEVFHKTVVAHCKRIYPTIGYAVAQQNNHGISEAAALYVAGHWLVSYSSDPRYVKLGVRCRDRGHKVLEGLMRTLVLGDGGFSMSSFSYHRAVLDTLSMVEFWCKVLRLPPFSSTYRQQAASLVDFLFQVLDLVSGDVPNVGANDGSRAYLLTSSDYRDFRPSLQLASGYFSDSLAFQANPIEWYSASLPAGVLSRWDQVPKFFTDSGFASLRFKNKESWGLVRFPAFHFRPAQSDVMHFDLWWRGQNILCDSGSYSYNCAGDIEEYFAGALGHNVVHFDSRESMARLGKFLWGEWLKADQLSSLENWVEENVWFGQFTDYLGASHRRVIRGCGDRWLIKDEISNYTTAILRWHLCPRKWSLQGNILISKDVKIRILSSCPLQISLVRGARSLYYGQFSDCPLLEIQCTASPAEIVTEVELSH